MRPKINGLLQWGYRWTCALGMLAALGCTSFLGATLPPGASGGVFSKNPKGLPVMSRVMHNHQKDLNQATLQKVEKQFRVLRHLNVTSKDFRKQLVRRSTKWRKMLANDNRLSKQELNLILEGAHWAVELDTLLFSIWKEYRSFLPYSSEPDIYAPSRGANLLEKTTRMKGGLLILAAEMMRMDNAGSIIEAAKELPLLTYLMNRGDSKIGVPGESFDRITGQFFEPDRRWLLRKFLFDIEYSQHELNSLAAHDNNVAFALAVIRKSKQAQRLKKEGPIGRQTNYTYAVTERTWMSILTPYHVWKLNRMMNKKGGRKTKSLPTLAETENATEAFYDHLEPMDVILIDEQKREVEGEKERFDHAVIYLGTFQEIKENELMDHSAIDIYGNALRRGYTFLELAGTGIKLWNLEEILQVNEVVLVRYTKQRALDNLSRLNSEDSYEAPAIAGVTDESEQGWDRSTGTVIEDNNVGELTSLVDRQGHWKAFSQKSMQQKALLKQTLDLMLQPNFVSPPSLSDPERSSVLISSVFGLQSLGVSLRSGQNMPSLNQMITAAVVMADTAQIPLVVLNGEVHEGGKAKLFLVKNFTN